MTMPTNPLLVLATLVTCTACADGGNIWYKLSGKGDGTPVILLHGGPGFTVKAVRAQLNTSDPRGE